MIKFFEYLTKSKFQCFFVILVFSVLLSILNYRIKSKVENFSTSIDCESFEENLEHYKDLNYLAKFKFLTCDTVMTKVIELFPNTYLADQTDCDNILKVYLDNAYVLYQIYREETTSVTLTETFSEILISDTNSCKKLKFLLSGEFMYYVLIRFVKFDKKSFSGITYETETQENNTNQYNTIVIPYVEYNTSLHVKLEINGKVNYFQYKQNVLDSTKFVSTSDYSLQVDHNGGTLTATIHKEYNIAGDTLYSMTPIVIDTSTIDMRPNKHYLTNFENHRNDLQHFPFYIFDTHHNLYIKQNWDGGNIRGRHLLGYQPSGNVFYLRKFKHESEDGYKIFSNTSSGDSFLCWDRGGRQSSPVVKQERCDGVTDNQIMFLQPVQKSYWTIHNNKDFRIQDQRGEVLKRVYDDDDKVYKYKFEDEQLSNGIVFRLVEYGENYHMLENKTIVKD